MILKSVDGNIRNILIDVRFKYREQIAPRPIWYDKEYGKKGAVYTFPYAEQYFSDNYGIKLRLIWNNYKAMQHRHPVYLDDVNDCNIQICEDDYIKLMVIT